MVSSLIGGSTTSLFGTTKKVDPVKARLQQLNSGLDAAVANAMAPGNNLSAAQIRAVIAGPQNNTTASAAGQPPWEDKKAALERLRQKDAEKLQSLMSRTTLFKNGEEVNDKGGQTSEMKNLFLLHKGMDRLNQLAEYMQTGESRGQYSDLLERQFQTELKELRNFYNKMSFNSVTVSDGSSKISEKTNTLVADRETFFHGKMVGSPDGPLPGLTGNETFSISFDRGTTPPIPDLTVDLSKIDGDLSINNVVNLINDEIKAYNDLESTKTNKNAILTNFDLYKQEVKNSKGDFLAYKYGIKITPGLNESINMKSLTGGQDAVYLSGVQGGGSNMDSFVTKLDSLSGGVPNEVFYNKEATEGRDISRNVATDSQGNVYTLGTTNQDIGLHKNQSGSDDVVLRKYSQAGQLIWESTLGSKDTTSASAIKIDSKDNVIIAGQTFDTLSSIGGGGNGDSFVTKFDGTGKELWTHQQAPFASDGATSLTIGPDDSVFVGGYTFGNLPGESNQGNGDAFMRKLDADGKIQYDRQFGSSGSDTTAKMATDAAGNVFVASIQNGEAIIQKYADTDGSPPIWSTNLGAVSSGGISGLVVENGKIYVGGTSTGTIAGPVTAGQEHKGGSDAFVSVLNDAGNGSIDFTSYVGSNNNAADSAASLTVKNGEIFLAGTTSGSMDGTTQASGSVSDGFVTKLNASGVQDWTHQFGGNLATSVTGISIVENGSNVLSRLGLPEGDPYDVDDLTAFRFVTSKDTNIVSQSSMRAGQSFTLAVNGGTSKTVTLDADDSMGFFAFKMNKILGNDGRATVENGENGQYISITAFENTTIKIGNGPKELDALPGLGISPGSIYGSNAGKNVFSLGLLDTMSIADKDKADDATVIFAGAMRQIEKAYNKIAGIEEPDVGKLTPQNNGPAPERIQKQINSFNLALARLGGGVVA